jgi:hypothetical protein
MRLANAVLAPVAGRAWPLEPASLKRSAQRTAGLRDFGDDVPLDEPLALLCRSLTDEVDLHPVGRLGLRRLIVTSLVNRLRLRELARRRPEVFTRPVTAPLVIVGPPRSGTTFLHRLLSCDPGLRTAPFWELWQPVPADGEPRPGPVRDRRVAAGRRAVRLATWIAPATATMHELDSRAADEEIIVLASAFSSIMYEWSVGVPAYAAWYRRADHTPGYHYLRRVLQAMQWVRPAPGRWLLKAPQHLEQLVPLFRAFPDATVVHTHRDPVPAVASMASFVTYAARTYVDRPDPYATGERCAHLVERLLRAAHRDRDPADGRYVDVYYADLCRDPEDVVRRVYAAAGLALSPPVAARMATWLADHRQGRYGTHGYAPEDFGLDVTRLRDRFAFYYRNHPRVHEA